MASLDLPPTAARSWARAWVLLAYVTVGAISGLAAVALRRNPLVVPAWLGTQGAASVLVSTGLGAVVGVMTVVATRLVVRRAAWARALHADLRPAVRDAGDTTLVLLALASGVGEELLFRGLLVPLLGIIASSIAFGALHQVRGRARWPYVVWATLMGFLFALLFRATGSLLGCIVAHALVNMANLRLLRDVDPEPPRQRALGGLLGRS